MSNVRKIKVLLIDDEKDFIMITKINLEQTGNYTVKDLSTAKDIVSQVKLFNPDIILLDILMPEIDGVKACQMLKSEPGSKKIPVIVLSALDTDKDRGVMNKLGTKKFLVKPIETYEIIAAIKEVLALGKKDSKDQQKRRE